ncbi:MAG TPA: hypothetical protein VFN97_19095, partial [Actinospica sp.]|nr:hypothetical protein [Actinospica sp.]
LGFAGLGMAIATYMKSWQDFEVVNLLMMPMFLFSTTFFPLGVYPRGLQEVSGPLPLHGTTWDALNIMYAFQWWLFILILGSWYFIHLRRELRPAPIEADDEDDDLEGDED